MKRYPTDELITKLQEFADDLGSTPRRTDVDAADHMPSAETYRTRFDSWNNALEAAGLEPTITRASHDLSDADLCKQLREFAQTIGAIPSKQQIDNADQLPSTDMYSDRFGSVTDALLEAGLLEPA